MKKAIILMALLVLGYNAFAQNIENYISTKIINDNGEHLEVLYNKKDYISPIPYIIIQIPENICALSMYSDNESDEKIIFNTNSELIEFKNNNVSVVKDRLEKLIIETDKDYIAFYDFKLQKSIYKISMIKNVITIYNNVFKAFNERNIFIAGGLGGTFETLKNEYIIVVDNPEKHLYPKIRFKNGEKLLKYYDNYYIQRDIDYRFFMSIEQEELETFKIEVKVNGVMVFLEYSIEEIKKCMAEEIKTIEILPINISY